MNSVTHSNGFNNNNSFVVGAINESCSQDKRENRKNHLNSKTVIDNISCHETSFHCMHTKSSQITSIQKINKIFPHFIVFKLNPKTHQNSS